MGVKLLVEYAHAEGYIAFEIPKFLSLGVIVVIFGVALVVRAAARAGRSADAQHGESRAEPAASAPVDRLDRRSRCWSRSSSAARVSGVWLSRYAVAVHRLTRGIGDTVFYGADGQPWFRLDEQRHDVSLDEIAPDLQHAVVAVEDRRFYYHPGIDPIGLGRAVVRDVRGGGRVEGGSTLTQQLARTLFLSNVRTFGRKIKEARHRAADRGAALEEADPRVLSEPRVPERRRLRRRDDVGASVPEAGERGDAAGGGVHRRADSRAVGAVALVELRRRARAQPRRAGADARAGAHHRRRRRRRRAACGRASSRTGSRTTCAPASRRSILRQQFRNEFGGDNPPDWQVHTSFLPAVQDAAERAVAAGLERLRRPGLEAALVAIDPATGDILAMVGGANYARSTYNRAVRSRRQPGSAFKPLVYAAALAQRLLAGVGADRTCATCRRRAIPNGARAARASSPTR